MVHNASFMNSLELIQLFIYLTLKKKAHYLIFLDVDVEVAFARRPQVERPYFPLMLMLRLGINKPPHRVSGADRYDIHIVAKRAFNGRRMPKETIYAVSRQLACLDWCRRCLCVSYITSPPNRMKMAKSDLQ